MELAFLGGVAVLVLVGLAVLVSCGAIGDDRDRILADKKASKGFTIRTDASKWEQGKFVHPHDACFDREDNIYVAEWVSTGRVTKLTRA